MVPLTAAQAMASRIATSGDAGFAGGALPVAAFQEAFSALRAAAAATSAATSEKTLHTFELSLWPSSFAMVASPIGWLQPRASSGTRSVPGVRAAMRGERLREPARMPRGDQ